MIRIGLGLSVTGYTGKYRIVIWIWMTFIALIPFVIVLTAVDWEVKIIVIPVSRHPLVL